MIFLDKLKSFLECSFMRFVRGFFKTIFAIFVIGVFTLIVVQRFSDNKVSLGGYRLYTVITGSMEPKFYVGEMVLAKEVDIKEIKVGDSVVYNGKVGDFNDKIIMHEVIKIRKVNGVYEFTTKGLSNSVEDPIVYADQIVAKVIYKPIVLSFISKIVNSLYGFYFILFVPITILIFIEVIRTINERRARKKNIENNESIMNECVNEESISLDENVSIDDVVDEDITLKENDTLDDEKNNIKNEDKPEEIEKKKKVLDIED